MKKKLTAISVGYILILSACESNTVSSGNEYEFAGTWELIDEDVSNTTCPPTIKFTGKDEMVLEGEVPTGEHQIMEVKYTRVFEDQFKLRAIASKVDGKTQEINEDEEQTINMKKDDDRLRLEHQRESCTYSLK
ncbi:hypothetical protein [Bacillus bingmayongensis]|uniref:hypothetical protein n=1 Tax=Bacillus bingmayongensis TaxID=1150157 RepID=UPI0003048D03|nr:hypothetical protein [Bacillus bingmayongensis]MBY0596070.1 hypothetical protein [Bacillus bingmayongensis]